jgi:hypothetical protein
MNKAQVDYLQFVVFAQEKNVLVAAPDILSEVTVWSGPENGTTG